MAPSEFEISALRTQAAWIEPKLLSLQAERDGIVESQSQSIVGKFNLWRIKRQTKKLENEKAKLIKRIAKLEAQK